MKRLRRLVGRETEGAPEEVEPEPEPEPEPLPRSKAASGASRPVTRPGSTATARRSGAPQVGRPGSLSDDDDEPSAAEARSPGSPTSAASPTSTDPTGTSTAPSGPST